MLLMTGGSLLPFFHQPTRQTFKEVLMQVGILPACRRLATTPDSIGQISFGCGYNSISLFNPLFKRIVKTTLSFRLSFRGAFKIRNRPLSRKRGKTALRLLFLMDEWPGEVYQWHGWYCREKQVF
ncbi:MAG: helix-turn-helix transcriptional regulator [Bacteroidetes bacterium]|nr:helix-turn-helix transcriptional regulator [Fibrella sp.]